MDRHLFDTRSLLELFIHETMVFLHILTEINPSIISAAYYMSNTLLYILQGFILDSTLETWHLFEAWRLIQ